MGDLMSLLRAHDIAHVSIGLPPLPQCDDPAELLRQRLQQGDFPAQAVLQVAKHAIHCRAATQLMWFRFYDRILGCTCSTTVKLTGYRPAPI